MRKIDLISVILVGVGLVACDFNRPEDYQPRAKYEAFLRKNAEEADRQAGGQESTAALDPEAQLLASGEKAYQTFCSSCHGADGKANSATAKALNPPPRNLTDLAWQKSVDDDHITKVIRDGGAAVGLSATMAPWGAALNEEQIKGLVKVVRAFGKPN